jgi:SNF2 family DNA or RNA helicase
MSLTRSKLSSTPVEEGLQWAPAPYQKKAMRFLIERAASALFLDPGLGKTSISLGAASVLMKKKVIKRVFVIAPVRVCHSVWPAEVRKWKDFHGLKMVVLHGPKKEALLDEDADIFVVNPEGLEWLFNVKKTKYVNRAGKEKTMYQVDQKRIKSLGIDLLIIDELSKFKNTNTGRFAVMKEAIKHIPRRWGLTGSPAANGLINLFAQCFVLDGGKALGRYVTHFRMEHFDKGYDGFSWNLKPGHDEVIYARVAPLALRMSSTDYLEMPDLIENKIRVSLPGDVMKHYADVQDDLVTKILDRKVSAATAAVASSKCRQMANGGVYLDEEVKALFKLPSSKREWLNVHDEKTNALEELVDELQGAPLLVAYEFGHDLDRILKRFPNAPFIGGGVSIKRAKELEDEWNAGRIPMLLGQPQSIGWGLNLQGASNHICWYSLTWDLEMHDQFIGRVWRQGNKHAKVFVHYLMADDTIDWAVYAALKSKSKGQNALFEALKKLRRG